MERLMKLSTNTFRRIAAAAVAASLAATVLAAATQTPPAAPQRSIDVAAAKERAAETFASAEADADGQLTPAEFAAAKPAHDSTGHHRARHRHGGDKPGAQWHAPTEAERAEFPAALFSALDTNQDGQLSTAEFAELRAATQALMQQHMFVRLDSNGDGVLTPDEFPAYPKRLSAADADGDGHVTKQEMRAARQAPATQPSN
jgi:Ca2+-binding EF-hand superfamily protein